MPSSEPEKIYFVHRYDVVRVKVAVKATDHAAAMKAADDYLSANHPVENRYLLSRGFEDRDIAMQPLPVWVHVEEPGQEIVGYLVDETNDPEFVRSRSYTPNHTPEHGHSEDQQDVPLDQWRAAVAQNETTASYNQWVAASRVNQTPSNPNPDESNAHVIP